MTPLFETMLADVYSRYPAFASLWEDSRREFGVLWVREFEAMVSALFGDNPAALKAAVDGYAEFCTDALRAQIFFERHKRYKATSYTEVAEACYHNPDFMFRCYLPGMFVSHYVWPHHHRMLLHFRKLLASLPPTETIAEVGVGCGIYSKEALARMPNAQGVGYDISAHALKFTADVIAAFGLSARFRTEMRDIVAETPLASDFLICQEVLEHLEDPTTFLGALHRMTRPGGHAYITAAVNAGHVDHIYLYRSSDEVRLQIVGAGFKIVEERAEFAYADKPIDVNPCLAAFLCRVE